ncbi:MAG: bifunctional (p)ppGpp synthetase/guanosine-3',5'-bis(diphosphate) 3'-pyrophosphohydrolase [Anaerolineae bacterium]
MKKATEVMDFEPWLASLEDGRSEGERELLRRAFNLASQAHANQKRASGEPYIQHCLAVAQMLAELRLDTDTLAAALLHDTLEDTEVTYEELETGFGAEIARLVDGVTKLGQIDQLSGMSERNIKEDTRAESLRKMFLAMVDDVRVVLIKLADRLHNMRTLSSLPEPKRKRIARETLEIFAPLANRLGIWQIKWELEDLALRHLEPDTYKEIATLIDERRPDRERYIAKVVKRVQEELNKAGINAEVSGRPKHIYSIYRKMRRKGVDFEQIYDVRGVRVIVETTRDCYAALGVIHSLWRPIPGEFDDYIATPKDNMYRSLHTAVVGPDGKPLEVQIRTYEMDYTAELGIAAHWRYKEGSKQDPVFDNKIAWLRQLMEWRQEVTDAHEFIDSLKTDVFQDRVYSFTPKGDIIDLPAGSTPIDFAYHIHTEVGHRCRGAKVNGKLVSLDYQLRNGDQVEILTSKRGGPSRDWLNPHLGYVRTSRARSKIRQWFKRQNREENIVQGREMLERELKRLGLDDTPYEQIARKFNYSKVDDLMAAIGAGDINAHQIAARALELAGPEEEIPEIPPTRVLQPGPTTGIRVRGVGDLLTNLARCCNPLPGDDIVGYITRGRGVTIHRRDCPNALRTNDLERWIEVDWGTEVTETHPVNVRVEAYDRQGLLRDIASIVADESINLSAANVATRKKDNMATMTVTLEIADIAQLSRVLARIERLPNVVEARRQVG